MINRGSQTPSNTDTISGKPGHGCQWYHLPVSTVPLAPLQFPCSPRSQSDRSDRSDLSFYPTYPPPARLPQDADLHHPPFLKDLNDLTDLTTPQPRSHPLTSTESRRLEPVTYPSDA